MTDVCSLRSGCHRQIGHEDSIFVNFFAYLPMTSLSQRHHCT